MEKQVYNVFQLMEKKQRNLQKYLKKYVKKFLVIA